MKYFFKLVAAALLIFITLSGYASDLQRVQLGSASESYTFPFYSSHDLTGDLTQIREIIIVIHGIRRNGDVYFESMQKLSKQSGRNPKEILIIAPNFTGATDLEKKFEGMPVWATRDWAAGLNAKHGDSTLSSFKVLDDLLLKITDRIHLPELTSVILAGHSAGAQFIQRYAVLNQIDEKIRALSLDLRYVVANPSSFLYFTPQRPSGRTFKDFPEEQCPLFNLYRYGLVDVIPYAGVKNSQELYKRYAYRNIVYLMGDKDTEPDANNLDKSCPAMAQGATRLSRAQAYVRYERFLAGRATKINHLAYEIVGVGHQQSKMFGSVCAMMVLFQHAPDKKSQAATCQPYLF